MANLHDASRAGDVSLVVQLIGSSHQSGVNARDKHNRTPLHLAAWAGHADVAKVLLSFDAEVDSPAQDGVTPLSFAVQSARVEAVKVLIEAGANVNQVNRKTGKTILMQAAQKGNLDILRMLIDAGADGAAKTKSGQTAIDLASSEEVKAVLQTALSRGSVAAAGREVGEEEEGKPEGKKRARVSKVERKEEMKEKGEGDDSLVVPPPASKGEEGKE